jgi:D-apionolactonase
MTMIDAATLNALLHGSTEAPPEMRVLRAGPVTVLLDGVDLRYMRIGRTELVRRIYAAVRDRNWNTVPPQISKLEVDAHDDSFEIHFQVRNTSHDLDFSWDGALSGDAQGRVTASFDGRAERDIEYNRIGLCIHHPWRETAGRPYRAGTPEGEIDGSFPSLIGPQSIVDGVIHPLFPPFDRLEMELDGGGTLLFEFEGDLWETEDHRNWTDANLKTYSTPLSLGFPHVLAAGASLVQRITVTPSGIDGESASGDAVRLTLGQPTGTRIPAIGLGLDSDGHVPSTHEGQLVAALAPAHLRVEARLDQDVWRDNLRRAREVAGRLGTGLEVSLQLRPEHAKLLSEVGETLAGGPNVECVHVTLSGSRTSTPEETTPAELVVLARTGLADALPGAAFVGGTEMYFTEINRTRPQPAAWDGVCFSITPQIHAFTNVDVIETLDAQAENVRSAHALAGGKPIHVSPVTLRRRVNIHATTPDPEAGPGELPDAVDVRQSSLLGAAWTVGSVKYLAEAGAAAVTYYETTGWRGVVERDEGTSLPERFHSRAGEPFPLYHALADATGWRGAEVIECESEDRLAAIGLAVRVDGRTALLLANVTQYPQEVVVGPLEGQVTLRRLDAATAAEAGSAPESFRASSEAAEASGDLAVRLEPYEVVRVDPAG